MHIKSSLIGAGDAVFTNAAVVMVTINIAEISWGGGKIIIIIALIF